MKDRPSRYGPTARLLHWIGVAVVVVLIPVGLVMTQDGLPRPLQNSLFILHKNLGALAILYVALRLGWRAYRGAPPEPATLPDWQKRAARATHWALYALLVIMPISGYVRVRAGGFPVEALDAIGLPAFVPRSDALADLAQAVHYYAGLAFMAIIALHVAAALRHALQRDGVMARIWPPLGPRGTA